MKRKIGERPGSHFTLTPTVKFGFIFQRGLKKPLEEKVQEELKPCQIDRFFVGQKYVAIERFSVEDGKVVKVVHGKQQC